MRLMTHHYVTSIHPSYRNSATILIFMSTSLLRNLLAGFFNLPLLELYRAEHRSLTAPGIKESAVCIVERAKTSSEVHSSSQSVYLNREILFFSEITIMR